MIPKAYYALSGDPITHGHLWIIEEAIKMFDCLHIALAINRSKKYTFTLEERVEMVGNALMIKCLNSNTVSVGSIAPTEFTVLAAQRAGAKYLIRGVRNAADFENEMTMANFNSKLAPEVRTVFLPTPPHLSHVSSSFVKSLVGLEGWKGIINDLVTPLVAKRLEEKLV